MQNNAIELHDSTLDAISLQSGCALLHFSAVYIHRSPGTPGLDAGSGWVQEAFLRIGDAKIEGLFSELPGDLLDGSVSLDETVLSNVIPIPLKFEGRVELRLEIWSEVVTITGSSVELELIGEPEYVEEFRSDMK